MEDRLAKLERKYGALKSNVEGLHAVRVDMETRFASLNSNVSNLATTVASLG